MHRSSHAKFAVTTFANRTPLHVGLSLSRPSHPLSPHSLLLLIARKKIGPKWSVSSKTIWREDRHRFWSKNFRTQLPIFHFIVFFLPWSLRIEKGEGEMGFISGFVMGMIVGVALIAGWGRAMARRAAKRSNKASATASSRFDRCKVHLLPSPSVNCSRSIHQWR